MTPDRPPTGGEPLNTGVPASMPAGSAPWDPDPGSAPRPGYQPPQHPGFGPPDPAAVSGPPWPVLVASGPYTPPPLVRWPPAIGVALFAVYLGLAIVAGTFSLNFGGSTVSHAAWVARHEATIQTLNRDQAALRADSPASGGNAAQWLRDWRTFHDDAILAASLPNPGGPATVPWREMLNDYTNGSSEIIQGAATQNAGELQQANRNLQAGDQAAHRFNQDMGIPTP